MLHVECGGVLVVAPQRAFGETLSTLPDSDGIEVGWKSGMRLRDLSRTLSAA